MNVENMLDITSASKSLIFCFSRELSANVMQHVLDVKPQRNTLCF